MFFEDKPRATRTDKLCCLALAGLLVTTTLVYEATDGATLRAAEVDKPPAITMSVPTVVIDTLAEAVEVRREAQYMEDVPLPPELQETLREAC